MSESNKKENVLAPKFLKCILNHRILSQEEESKLSLLTRLSKKGARNLLVLYNQRLVADLALKMYRINPSLELEDFYSEGNIGLIKAAERFDFTKGARFATFASYYVQDAMRQYAKRHSKILSHSAKKADLESEPALADLYQEDAFTKSLIVEELYKTLAKLPSTERTVLINKFGLFGRKPSTLEEIGKMLGLTKQRIGQLEKQALKNCRKFEISMV
jgi:RNA polymerase sigma factor (sigma-70 family)